MLWKGLLDISGGSLGTFCRFSLEPILGLFESGTNFRRKAIPSTSSWNSVREAERVQLPLLLLQSGHAGDLSQHLRSCHRGLEERQCFGCFPGNFDLPYPPYPLLY